MSGRPDELTLAAWLDAVAAPTPTPGGGGAAATTTALAAALVAMAARIARDADGAPEIAERVDAIRGRALELAVEDAAAYTRVLGAYRLPEGSPGRWEQITTALEEASCVPLEIAESAAEVARLAADIAERGKDALLGDAATAAHLAVAAARSAAGLVAINARYGELGPLTPDRARAAVSTAESALAVLPAP